jgi:hypothetical protein
MAHYAFLDENNVVTEVIVGKDESNFDWETKYGMFRGQTCKRTSYNTRGGVHYDPNTNEPSADQSKAFRKNYAGIGYVYDAKLDAFIPPKMFLSWVLNEQSCLWEPPVSYPLDGNRYDWNEETKSWESVDV